MGIDGGRVPHIIPSVDQDHRRIADGEQIHRIRRRRQHDGFVRPCAPVIVGMPIGEPVRFDPSPARRSEPGVDPSVAVLHDGGPVPIAPGLSLPGSKYIVSFVRKAKSEMRLFHSCASSSKNRGHSPLRDMIPQNSAPVKGCPCDAADRSEVTIVSKRAARVSLSIL